jgi:hypothetical protein
MRLFGVRTWFGTRRQWEMASPSPRESDEPTSLPTSSNLTCAVNPDPSTQFGLGGVVSKQVIERTNGRSVLVFVNRGFIPFCDALKELKPDLDVQLGWQARLAEAFWWPATTGFRRQ